MDEKTYKLILADGTVVDNLTLNGTNFVSKTEVRPETFEDNCSPMTVVCDGNEEVHEHAEFLQIMELNGEYLIAFRDISDRELLDMKTRSDIDYLAMMADISLEEE